MRNDPSAWNPFSASPLQAGQQPGTFQPQGGDFGSIAQQIAGRVAQNLPGLIMHVMASSPLAQQFRQQVASAWQGGQSQNMPGQDSQNYGGLGLNQLSSGYGGGAGFGQQNAGQQYGQQFQPQQFGQLQPQHQQYGQQSQPQQFGGQLQPQHQQQGQQFQPQQFGGQHQQHGQQFQPQQFGQFHSQHYGQLQPQQFGGQLQQQGIDVAVVQQIAGTVAQHLPGLILNLLASSPQLSQALRQQAALQMGNYGGGAGINPLGAGQQSGYLQQQGSEFAQQVAGTIAQHLSGHIMSVLASSPQLSESGGAGSTAIH